MAARAWPCQAEVLRQPQTTNRSARSGKTADKKLVTLVTRMHPAMPDDRQQLLSTIEQLRQQLDNAPSVDSAVAARLRKTLSDIESTLAGQRPAGSGGPNLGERVGQVALDFEASHPVLAGNLGSIIDALGRMGI